jgi:hypothetical protein
VEDIIIHPALAPVKQHRVGGRTHPSLIDITIGSGSLSLRTTRCPFPGSARRAAENAILLVIGLPLVLGRNARLAELDDGNSRLQESFPHSM